MRVASGARDERPVWRSIIRGAWKPSTALPRDADAIAWDGAQHQRAGREAWPIDDHPLAGLPHAREGLKIISDKAAGARQDAQIRARLRHGDQGQDGSKKKAFHSMSPASSAEGVGNRGSKLSGSFAACRPLANDPL